VLDTGSYGVLVTNSYGCMGADSIHVGLKTTGCPSEVNNIISRGIVLFPNPASDFISIQDNGNSGMQHISIYNEYGALVYDKEISAGTKQQEISTGRFATGIYLVKIMGTNGQFTEKLVIEK